MIIKKGTHYARPLQSIQCAIGTGVGVNGSATDMQYYADLSYGPIKITTGGAEDNTKTHVYLFTVEIL